MSNLTKSDIGKRLATNFGVTAAIGDDIVDAVFDQITKSLAAGEGVELRGFASWSVTQRGAKVGRNPRTGESVAIPPRKAVKFKASKTLTGAIN